MKKEYTKPEMEVTSFEAENTIMVSGVNETQTAFGSIDATSITF